MGFPVHPAPPDSAALDAYIGQLPGADYFVDKWRSEPTTLVAVQLFGEVDEVVAMVAAAYPPRPDARFRAGPAGDVTGCVLFCAPKFIADLLTWAARMSTVTISVEKLRRVLLQGQDPEEIVENLARVWYPGIMLKVSHSLPNAVKRWEMTREVARHAGADETAMFELVEKLWADSGYGPDFYTFLEPAAALAATR